MLGFSGISAADALAISVVLGLLMMSVSMIGGIAWLMTRNSRPEVIGTGQE